MSDFNWDDHPDAPEFIKGPIGARGADGRDGKDGVSMPGLPGKPGRDGKDARSIVTYKQNEEPMGAKP